MMLNSIGKILPPGDFDIKTKNYKNFSRFEQGKPVIVMTHGWNSNWGSGSWLNDMRDVFK